MKQVDTYVNLCNVEPVWLQKQLTVLSRAVVVLAVLVVVLFVGLVCVAVLLYGQIQDAQTRRGELELPVGDQEGRTVEDASLMLYIKKVIQQVLQNNTDNKDKEAQGDFLPWGPYHTIQGDGGKTFISKPMAHLTGSATAGPQSLAHGQSRGTTLRVKEWESNQGLATLANGMKYRDGYIRVPVDGLYYIYSQLYFRYIRTGDEGHVEEHQLLHTTYKKSATYPDPQEVMKSARTKCWSKRSQYGLLSSYQGGVFRLRAGDRLFVAVSNVSMVSFEEAASYFGAFMI